ncbi:MAG: precorrin-6y C5,15-methyltransferase (decarboxylating) subunit CbiE [Solirubrobacteraceae bacterium]|jgi:precorrin-6Y C5,15-methyltransferase (decarboxylating)
MNATGTAGTPVRLAVVGIGADGWAGLGEAARGAVLAAAEVVGSARQLALLPANVEATQRPWPSPIDALVEELVERALGRDDGSVCVLASGDPMLHGIGATLARRLPADRFVVYPHPSAFALACARLGWPAAEVELVSAVAQPPEVVARLLQPRRRLVVYATGVGGAAAIAALLREHGFGPSRFVVLEQLGGTDERIVESTAAEWGEQTADPLHCVAIECSAELAGDAHDRNNAAVLPLVPGLPDDAYEHDGQLTKRHVRAITLAALGPTPGALLWDVGAGSGSIAIEWLRAEPSARAFAVERHAERAERARANASRLGVPRLEVVLGAAPEALCDLPGPDAIFIGGGLTSMNVVQRCWYSLRPGGTIVANAVTLEGERVLMLAREHCGGELARIEIAHVEPLGTFQAWRPQLPVVQWSARKGPVTKAGRA